MMKSNTKRHMSFIQGRITTETLITGTPKNRGAAHKGQKAKALSKRRRKKK